MRSSSSEIGMYGEDGSEFEFDGSRRPRNAGKRKSRAGTKSQHHWLIGQIRSLALRFMEANPSSTDYVVQKVNGKTVIEIPEGLTTEQLRERLAALQPFAKAS